VLQVSLRLDGRRLCFVLFILDTENICELFIAAAALDGNPINQRRSVEECEVKEFYIFFSFLFTQKVLSPKFCKQIVHVLYGFEQRYQEDHSFLLLLELAPPLLSS
jgi:hypothetical protein